MIISGPQDLAVGYCYVESCSHHLKLQAAAVDSDELQAKADHPGNVAIRGVKIHAYQAFNAAGVKGLKNTSVWMETNGWVGNLLYTNSQAEYCDACSALNAKKPGSPEALACKCCKTSHRYSHRVLSLFS